MSQRPRLLDLFCGAGGAAMGYHRAGFEVVGVDIKPQKNYPFEFHQADAMTFPLEGFDAIHASPPCQAYSLMTKSWGRQDQHPDLVAPVRERLAAAHLPFVIENVPGAPLRDYFTLCGSSFGLRVRRHRIFESSVFIWAQPCSHSWQDETPIFRVRNHGNKRTGVAYVFGHGTGKANEHWAPAMGIGWMTRSELAQAIPPAYTEYIGKHLLEVLS